MIMVYEDQTIVKGTGTAILMDLTYMVKSIYKVMIDDFELSHEETEQLINDAINRGIIEAINENESDE